MVAGRKPAVQPPRIECEVLKFQIYNDDYTLKKRKDQVWQDLSTALKLTPINIYNYVYQDRHNVLSNYNKFHCLEEKVDNLPDTDEILETQDDSMDDEPVTKKPKLNGRLEFDLKISPKIWADIKPINVLWKDGKERKRLQNGWTGAIRKLIWNKTKLPCAFTFSGHSINDCVIEAEGFCIQCRSKLKLISNTYSENKESATFLVETKNTLGKPHSKKIRLQKAERKKVEKELMNKTPLQWRIEKAEKEMEQGDQEPPDLYSLRQLRDLKRKITKNNKDLEPGQNLGLSCITLKNQVEVNEFIKEVGPNDFYIIVASQCNFSGINFS